jgi:formate dehydrogenase gamma subunit
LETWVDSYHGLKSKAGDMTVANCASCHGAHRILSHTDSTSSIHPDNLLETCSECHKGISAEMALTPVHSDPGISQTPLANIVRQIYIIIIIVTIGLMLLHWLIDIRKEIKSLRAKPQITRMTMNEVWQHHLLMTSFIILVISGFALRFSEAFWVQWLFGWEGGFPLRGILHRVAAVILMIATLWHLLYLMTPRGKQFFKDMIPNHTDWRHLVHLVGYNLGMKDTKPRFGRFMYVEKVEYWALIWGTMVMIISGLLLWLDNLAIIWVPKGFLDVMLVIHYYEAWLATLAIIIWHMYSTIFNPGIYPMNPAWINGKMPVEMYRHEHPEDPAVRNIDKET